MKRDLRGKSAIITGASRGIGKAIALKLGGAGMTVGLLARDSRAMDEVCAEVDAAGGVAIASECDLANLESLPAVLRSLAGRLGEIDCLINNAGVFLECPLAEIPTEQWQATLEVNLSAPFVCCRELIPRLVESRGRIINIASTAASQGYLNQSAYCASKHGLLGMSRALAIELKPHGVQVTCISPGGVDTGLIEGTYLGERLEGQVKIQPEDVAESVLHVLGAPENVEFPEIVMRRFSSE